MRSKRRKLGNQTVSEHKNSFEGNGGKKGEKEREKIIAELRAQKQLEDASKRPKVQPPSWRTGGAIDTPPGIESADGA